MHQTKYLTAVQSVRHNLKNMDAFASHVLTSSRFLRSAAQFVTENFREKVQNLKRELSLASSIFPFLETFLAPSSFVSEEKEKPPTYKLKASQNRTRANKRPGMPKASTVIQEVYLVIKQFIAPTVILFRHQKKPCSCRIPHGKRKNKTFEAKPVGSLSDLRTLRPCGRLSNTTPCELLSTLSQSNFKLHC